MRKGQVAMEYLMIFGLTIALTLPLLIIYVTQTQNMQADITAAQLDKLSFEIASAAKEVYYMGEPAQKTIYITFPANIQSVTIDGKLMIFEIDSAERDYNFYKDVPMNLTGSLRSYEGVHTVVVKAEGAVVNIADI